MRRSAPGAVGASPPGGLSLHHCGDLRPSPLKPVRGGPDPSPPQGSSVGRLAPGFTGAGSTKIALSWPPVAPAHSTCSVLRIRRTGKLGGEGNIKSTEQMGKLRPRAGQDRPRLPEGGRGFWMSPPPSWTTPGVTWSSIDLTHNTRERGPAQLTGVRASSRSGP